MRYPYEPLPIDGKRIRLLTTTTVGGQGVGRDTSQTRWSLRTISLDDFNTPTTNDHEIYWALSYTWLSEGESEDIIIDGCPVPITANLAAFLHAFGTSPEFQRSAGVWIDQLCINQEDYEEKPIQIKLMGNIYKQASGTIAWLGAAANGSDKVVHSLKSLTLAAPQSLDTLEGSFWDNLEYFPGRPYWERLWVVQEIVLSHRSMRVMCGKSYIHWKDLILGLREFLKDPVSVTSRHLDAREYLGKTPADSFLLNRIRRVLLLATFCDYYATHETGLSLMDVLQTLRSSKQHCVKDKVYGVLSILDPAISGQIYPDYKLSDRDVFTNFAKTCVDATGTLDIILHSGSQLVERKQDELPSWVPDWTVKESSLTSMAGSVSFRASRDSKTSCIFNSDGCLSIQGFRIDIIDGLGKDLFDAYIPGAQTSPIVQSIHGQLRNPYGDDKGIRNALWRTLVANRQYNGSSAIDSYENILNVSVTDLKSPVAHSYPHFHNVFNTICHINGEFRIGGREFICHFGNRGTRYFTPFVPEIYQIIERAANLLLGRKLVVTEDGYFGLTTRKAKQGDIIAILLGCSVPVVLRPCGDRGWKFIGESYVHGFMEGEAMAWLESGRFNMEIFELR